MKKKNDLFGQIRDIAAGLRRVLSDVYETSADWTGTAPTDLDETLPPVVMFVEFLPELLEHGQNGVSGVEDPGRGHSAQTGGCTVT